MSDWLEIKDAPIKELGHVWCEKLDRTDLLGFVITYDDGRRGVVSSARGFDFTHWHKLPDPPKP